jgi:hypothetical protein
VIVVAFLVLVVGLTVVFVKGPQAWRRLNAYGTARFVALSPLAIVAAFRLVAYDFNRVVCPSCPDSGSLSGLKILANVALAIPVVGALVGVVGIFRFGSVAGFRELARTSAPEKAPPGWRHADLDPPGTERYWDGSAWGAPRQIRTYDPDEARDESD